jgi:hypothetical protein
MHPVSFRTRALALSVLAFGAFCATHAPEAQAAFRTVTNCNNSGAGSLRAAAAVAVSGDTIDLRGLSCTPVLLTTGAVVLPQANITLLGRDRLATTIRSNGSDRVFRHTGTGTLTVRRLSVSYGRYVSGGALGGCLYSEGNIALRESRVHHCTVVAQGGLEPSALGGGAFARGNIIVQLSSVFANEAQGGDADGGGLGTLDSSISFDRSQVYDNIADGDGGGVWACHGVDAVCSFTASYSTFARNIAGGDAGAIDTAGDFTLNKSTVYGNQAGNDCGAMCVPSDGTKVITDSTITGNRAGGFDSAGSFTISVQILNSTIAFNHEDPTFGECEGAISSPSIELESSIVSGNTCSEPGAIDIGGFPGYTITGSHNLVGASSFAALPPDTIVTSNPGLFALALNGGPTRTHALMATSPAIDAGSNILGRAFDQRGSGFPRVNGAGPDIGAFER